MLCLKEYQRDRSQKGGCGTQRSIVLFQFSKLDCTQHTLGEREERPDFIL